MKKANIIAACIGIIFSVYAFAVTLTFKKFPLVPVGPEFFPRYLSIGLFICSAVLLVQSILSTSKDTAPTLSIFDKGMQRLLISLAIVIIYVISWSYLGFLLSTPILLFIIMHMLGMKKISTKIIVSVCASVGIFFLFKLILNIEMPLGFMDGIF